jgi:transposase
MVEGRSKQAFKTWLTDREESWREGVEVVAMDGFAGFKTATVDDRPAIFPRSGALNRCASRP